MTAIAFSMDTPTRRWADDEDVQEGEISRTEPAEDGSYRKVVVSHRTDEATGQRFKVIKTIRVYKRIVRVNKAVEIRRQWRKFGQCASLPAGPESGVTTIGEEIHLQLRTSAVTTTVDEKPAAISFSILCRNCGKRGHWTRQCPVLPMSTPSVTPPTITGGKYVLPSKRPGALDKDYEDSKIRLANLAEETTKVTLYQRTFSNTRTRTT